MGSTPQRSFVKGMCWEVISLILTTFAVYIVYGDIFKSIKFALVLTAIKIVLFYPHERIWKKIKWGKINN
jgi:adenylylsulfate kinase